MNMYTIIGCTHCSPTNVFINRNFVLCLLIYAHSTDGTKNWYQKLRIKNDEAVSNTYYIYRYVFLSDIIISPRITNNYKHWSFGNTVQWKYCKPCD